MGSSYIVAYDLYHKLWVFKLSFKRVWSVISPDSQVFHLQFGEEVLLDIFIGLRLSDFLYLNYAKADG